MKSKHVSMAHAVCPAERARMLDNPLRSLLVRPHRLLNPYIKPGMTVLDVGCGPGFFITLLAELVGPSGHVIAADLQQEMLDIVREKLKRDNISGRVSLHKTHADSLDLTGSGYIDFTIAFHMVHEVQNPDTFFSEVYTVLKPGGLFLVSEPRGHVKKNEFDEEIVLAKKAGFTIMSDNYSLREFQVILHKA